MKIRNEAKKEPIVFLHEQGFLKDIINLNDALNHTTKPKRLNQPKHNEADLSQNYFHVR
jgi:hypothetical protein